MFQNKESQISLPAPIGGINTSSSDINYAKYIQNMLVNEDNDLEIRHGTSVVGKFDFIPTKIFTDQLKMMLFVTEQGTSETIIYQNYFIKIPYILNDKIVVTDMITHSKIEMDISNLSLIEKTYLKDRIYNELYIQVQQETVGYISDKAEISNVILTNNKITFDIPFKYAFFDMDHTDILNPPINVFELWFERASIYKYANDTIIQNPLLEDLSPNVIVNSINYNNHLLICNGIDPVLIYNGVTLEELKSDVQITTLENIAVTDVHNLTMKVSSDYQVELQKYLYVNGTIKITNASNITFQDNIITNIVFNVALNVLTINITVQDNIIANAKNIIYKKEIPRFNNISIINDRLFALDSGITEFNRFRPASKSMLVYYCAKRKSLCDWYNKKGIIESMNLAVNSNKPDDLQCIVQFQGRILFWGKESVQIWTGTDPTIMDDRQDIQFGDFRWHKTENIGLFQKTMYIELPNEFIFLSKYGISSIVIDGFNNININLKFASTINMQVKKQLENVSTNREYRNLTCFLYPYGNFVGFKFLYNCYVYQLLNNGVWVVFNESFTQSKCFLYNPINKNLYLINNNTMLLYCDKLPTRKYVDYDNKPIFWMINYNWIYPGGTWGNISVHIACRSVERTNIDLCIYSNMNQATCNEETIVVNQENSLYDYDNDFIDKYSYNDDGIFPYEVLRFDTDCFMISLKGIVKENFIFDKVFLCGGLVNVE